MAFRVPEWLGGRKAPEPVRAESKPERPVAKPTALGAHPGVFSPRESDHASDRAARHLAEKGATGFERAGAAAEADFPDRMSVAARGLTTRLNAATAEAIASRPHLSGAFSVVDEVLSFHLRHNALPGDGASPPPFPELRDELTLQVGIGVNASFRDFHAAQQTLKKVEALRSGAAGAQPLAPSEDKDVAKVLTVWNNEKRSALFPWARSKDPFWTLNPRQRSLLALSWLAVPWGSGRFSLG